MASFYVSKPAVRATNGEFGLALVGSPTTKPTDLPAYRGSDGQIWFGLQPGQEFGVELVVPQHGGPYGIILTVDGINSYSGEQSSGDIRTEGIWVSTPPTGPGKNIVPGWLLPGGSGFAAFTFNKKEESYAARRGFGTANTGVVGARIWFKKKQHAVSSHPGYTTRGFGGADYGRQVPAEIQLQDFVHDEAREPITLVVRYAEESKLVAAGFVKIGVDNNLPHNANPFPGKGIAGCPPPANWNG